MTTTPAPDVLTGRFAAMIKPTRRNPDRPVTEDQDFVLMLWRQVRALEARAIENPELLTQCLALTQRLSEVVNVTIAANAARFAVDPRRGASMAECGRLLGISKQSASERKQRGEAVMAARIEAAGAVRFGEAKREREAVQAAAEHAVVNLDAYRARHSAA